MSNKEARRQEWIALIEDYKSSGLTMAAWCAANQFTLHTLRYWLRKLKGTSSSVASASRASIFVPLTVSDTGSTATAQAPIIVRIGEASIELRDGFDPRLFQNVVLALRSSC